jgi:hypothetical protein
MCIPYQSRSQSQILYRDVFCQRWVCSYLLLLMILIIDCYIIMLWWLGTMEKKRKSRLGGFTFKSNKYHKNCFTKLKCSSAHKEDSFNPPLRFSNKSQDPHKERLERAHKGLGWMYFMGGTSFLQRREGEIFYTCPPKTSRWKLDSKNWNIRFWKLEHPVFEN